MKTYDLNDWTEFNGTIDEIRADYGSYKVPGSESIYQNLILFRGHASSIWKLETTLERYSKAKWTVKIYSRLALRSCPQIEAFTDYKWHLPTWPEVEKKINDNFDNFFLNPPNYEFWVYLRHHGFPSPLLDWTESPYIAAFFAFNEKNAAERIAIYAFIETPRGVKSGGSEPQITVLGPYTPSHKRHFIQQSNYTVCVKAQNKEHEFISHETVFQRGDMPKEFSQDVLVKITIPAGERMKVLTDLYDYNINEFSLFQNEESLMKTMAFKEIELNEKP